MNFGTGATSITASGLVTASDKYGVLAFNDTTTTADPAGDGLKIDLQTVSGNTYGIAVANSGAGATRVTAGSVSGTATGSSGIFATNGVVLNYADFLADPLFADRITNANATDLIVTAGAVYGDFYGIFAANAGTGATSITATGAVTSASRFGINAWNDPTATSLTIDAASVTGRTTGIAAANNGTGFTNIRASGTVTGARGIFAFNDVTTGVDGTDHGLRIAAADVSGVTHGIAAANSGAGATRVAAGDVSAPTQMGIGIIATNAVVTWPDFAADPMTAMDDSQHNANATDLIVTAGAVSGGYVGIYADNNGIGATVVRATGPVDGLIGIYARNGSDTLSLVVEAASVTSAEGIGILASNSGTQATEVKASGHVAGGFAGIFATNTRDATDLTVEAATIATAATDGVAVYAINDGKGATTVKASGLAQGSMFVSNGDDTTNLTIDVAGVNGAIAAVNDGRGATLVKASGAVTGSVSGGALTGILAWNIGAATTDLTVDAASVAGSIQTLNWGTGATGVAASGAVTGADYGVFAHNDATTTANAAGDGLTINVKNVSGGIHGIAAANSGAGITRITAGDVSASGAEGVGILASNAVVDGFDFVADPFVTVAANSAGNANATDLIVTAGAVSGGLAGIYTRNRGTGETRIAASGAVTATALGIYAINEATATDLTIAAAGASGDGFGIFATNKGAGATTITTRGLVEGGQGAAWAESTPGNAVALRNLAGGLLRNASGVSSDAAVTLKGGAVTLVNDAGILGTVTLDGALSRFENNGVWNGAGGVSLFGGGAGSTLVNTAGATVVGGANAAVAETTVLSGLSLFTTRGLVTLADGAAGDTLRVANGAAIFAAGSTLAVDVGGGASDRFVASGAIDLAGATLAANITGALAVNTRYTVLTAGGGLNGTFDSVIGLPAPTAFLTISTGYDANDAWLEAIKVRDFADAGRTPNQIATATGLDSIPPGGPLFTAVANLPTDAAARFAFDRLSGELHASARTALIEDSRFLRNAINDRIRSAFGDVGAPASPVLAYASADAPQLVAPDHDGLAFWANGFGSWGSTDGDGNAARLDRNASGVLTGVDAPVGGWRIGALAGYGHSSFKASDRASSGTSDNYHFGLYGGTQWGHLGLRAGHDIALGGANATLKAMVGWRHAFGDTTPTSTHAFIAGNAFTVAGVPIARDNAVVEAGFDVKLARQATLGVSYTGQLAGSARDHGFRANLMVKF